MTNYSLDSQPYAVLDDPRRLSVVSLPGRQALIQRMTVDIGTGGATPPDRLRVLVRAERDAVPVSALRVRVTDVSGVDLVEPRDVSPSVLGPLRQWRFVEVPLVPTVGFGSTADVEVLVWFTVSERGPGWEVAAPSTGEDVPEWRGPIDGTNPEWPVFGRLLTFPAAASVFTRLAGATLEPDTNYPSAGDVVGGDPVVLTSSAALFGGVRMRDPRAVPLGSGTVDVALDGSHAYMVGLGTGNVTILRKFTRDPFAWVQTAAMSSADVFGRCVTTHNGFAYIGTDTSPARVVKVNLSTMTRVASLQMPGSRNRFAALVNDGTHLYGVTDSSPARVVKVSMAGNMSYTGQYIFPSGKNNGAGIARTGTTLFVSLGIDPVEVWELPTSLASSTSHGSPPGFTGRGNGRRLDVAADGTFGVVVTDGGYAARFALGPFAWQGDSTALAGGTPLTDVRIDSDSSSIYVTTFTTPAKLRRYFYSATPTPRLMLSVETELSTDANEALGLALDDVHAFVAVSDSASPRAARISTAATVVSQVDGLSLSNSPLLQVPYFDSPVGATGLHVTGNDVFVNTLGRVVKYDSSTGTRSARTDLTAAVYGRMVADATHLYTAALTTSGQSTVTKLAKSDLSTSSLTLNAGEFVVSQNATTDDGTDLFLGCGSSPGVVVKAAMSSLTRTAALTLNSGENDVRAIAVDATHVYAVTDTVPARVVKIDKAAMTRTAAITLLSGEINAVDAVIRSGSLFVLLGTDPARVVEIDLATFTRTTAATMNANEGPGATLLTDGSQLWAGVSSEPARIVRLGDSLQATGVAHAIQINTAEDAADGLDYDRDFREDADVVTQFGLSPSPPDNVTVTAEQIDNTGCVTVVDVAWELPDDECATVLDGGYVEVQRQTGNRWVSVFRVFGDVTRTVRDVEVARNRANTYRVRIVNDAGFVSEWVTPLPVEVTSGCCGYVFASNQFPDLAVWYDDLGDRSYRFVEDVEFVEFEGRDGSVPLRPDADRLDEFDVTVMVAGFGVFGGTRDTGSLPELGRAVFRPLTNLTGNKRTQVGDLLRPSHLAVADNNGHVWFAEVETPTGDVVAEAGRYAMRVTVKETTRDPAPVDVRPAPTAPTGGVGDLPFSDPDNLLGS